jgi:DNA-binding NarL/FixJ family response regulator
MPASAPFSLADADSAGFRATRRTAVAAPEAAQPPQPPLRLALVEDDPVLRRLLHRYFCGFPEFEWVVVADSAENLWRELTLSPAPDLLLLDLGLPGQSGLEALPDLVAQFPTLGVIVQTGTDEAAVIYQALRHGAHGFVVKGATALPAYRDALLAVAAGGTVLSPATTRKMLDYTHALPATLLPLLSERERQVLEYLVAGRSEGFVAQALGLPVAGVAGCVARLAAKLHLTRPPAPFAGPGARGEFA